MDFILALNTPSEAGGSATRYAAALSQALQCELRLHGYYYVPVTLGDMPLPAISVEESRSIAGQQLETAATALRAAFPDVVLRTELVFGDAGESISIPEDQPQPLLIVIPNSESGEDADPAGIESDFLLRELRSPVLCVSPGMTAALPRRLAVAVSEKEVPASLNTGIVGLLKERTDVAIDIFSIRTAESQAPAPDGVRIVVAEHIESGIREEVQRCGADWLVIAPEAHGFLSGIFQRNHTAHLLRDLSIPVLAITGA